MLGARESKTAWTERAFRWRRATCLGPDQREIRFHFERPSSSSEYRGSLLDFALASVINRKILEGLNSYTVLPIIHIYRLTVSLFHFAFRVR